MKSEEFSPCHSCLLLPTDLTFPPAASRVMPIPLLDKWPFVNKTHNWYIWLNLQNNPIFRTNITDVLLQFFFNECIYLHNSLIVHKQTQWPKVNHRKSLFNIDFYSELNNSISFFTVGYNYDSFPSMPLIPIRKWNDGIRERILYLRIKYYVIFLHLLTQEFGVFSVFHITCIL